MKFNNPTCTRHMIMWTLLSVLLIRPAFALESDRDQPISIEADSVEINDGKGQSTYKGNVILTQGSIRITASTITVTQKDGTTKHVLATGSPVTFRQDGGKDTGAISGKANKAEYKADSDTLYLTGNAELLQGKDSFKSDRITYDRTKAVVKAGASAQGKQRVKVTIDAKPSNKNNQ